MFDQREPFNFQYYEQFNHSLNTCLDFLYRIGYSESSVTLQTLRDLLPEVIGNITKNFGNEMVDQPLSAVLVTRELIKSFAMKVRLENIDQAMTRENNDELPLHKEMEEQVFYQLSPEHTSLGRCANPKCWSLEESFIAACGPDRILTYFVGAMMDQEEGASAISIARWGLEAW